MNKKYLIICIICGLIGTAINIIKRYLYATRVKKHIDFTTLRKYVTTILS